MATNYYLSWILFFANVILQIITSEKEVKLVISPGPSSGLSTWFAMHMKRYANSLEMNLSVIVCPPSYCSETHQLRKEACTSLLNDETPITQLYLLYQPIARAQTTCY